MRTPHFTGVCIGSHLNRNATIGIHGEEVPKLVYSLFRCKPVKLGDGPAIRISGPRIEIHFDNWVDILKKSLS